jgi:hypothetical protein
MALFGQFDRGIGEVLIVRRASAGQDRRAAKSAGSAEPSQRLTPCWRNGAARLQPIAAALRTCTRDGAARSRIAALNGLY